jgi:signal transduction histidine kinase
MLRRVSVVLVADDEPAVLEVLSEVIEDLGHEVIRARDGKEALQLASDRLPDLIVSDHMMPRLSGLDLCKELRKVDRLRDTPIILLSAVLSQGAPEAQAFLAKPFELSDFETLVERMLAGAQVTPPPPRPPPEPASPEAEANTFLRRMSGRISAAVAALRELPPGSPEAAGTLLELEELAAAVADASRLGQGELTLSSARGDFKGLVSDAVTQFQTRHPGLELAVQLPGQPVEMDFDARRIRQAVDALLENAARHGTPPAKLSVELESTPSLALLKVTDFGRGILPADQRTLFERFGRPRGETAGLGTGLYIAAEITRLHGGVLAVRSAPKQGSTFTLGLPRLPVT